MNPRFITICVFILTLAFSRLVPHAPNFTPILAMALFGGAYFSNRLLAVVVPLAAMLLSDLLIGLHATMIFVYASCALTVLVGQWLFKNRLSGPRIIAANFIASIAFFIITNFGVWMTGELYTRDMNGLAQCFFMAIPFYANTLVSGLFFSAILFGGYAVLEKAIPALRAAK